MIEILKVTFIDRGSAFTVMYTDVGMAEAYITYAQLNGYGIELETVDVSTLVKG